MMTTGGFGMPFKEQYSTIGATGDISLEGNTLRWVVDQGGVTLTGTEEVGEHGLNEALHRCRKAIDALAETKADPTPADTPPEKTKDTPMTQKQGKR